jgi:hypothetical protein
MRRIVLSARAAIGLQLLLPFAIPPAAAQQPPAERASAVRVSVMPNPPFVERDDKGLYLNCDFRVENQTGEGIRLTRIEVATFDAANRISSRRVVSWRTASRCCPPAGEEESRAVRGAAMTPDRLASEANASHPH